MPKPRIVALIPALVATVLAVGGVQAEVETARPGDFNGIRNWREAGAQAREASEWLLEAELDAKEADHAELRRLVQALFAEKRNADAFFAGGRN